MHLGTLSMPNQKASQAGTGKSEFPRRLVEEESQVQGTAVGRVKQHLYRPTKIHHMTNGAFTMSHKSLRTRPLNPLHTPGRRSPMIIRRLMIIMILRLGVGHEARLREIH